MLKLKCLEKEQFDKFVIEQNISHYMQSESWGEFSKVYYNLTPYYLGLVNENDEVVGTTLLLEKKLKMNYNGYYIPFGFIADYNKNEIVREMTNKLIEFIKNKKGLYIKINPNIIKKSITYKDEEVLNNNYDEIINKLKTIGYKNLKESNIDTYIIDLDKSQDEIYNHLSKNIKDYIEENNLIVTETTTGNKSDLKALYNDKYNKNYYDTLYDVFNGNKSSKATILLEKINIIKTINEYEKKLKTINNQISIIPIDHLTKSSKDKLNTLTTIKKELLDIINKYKTIRKNHGNEVVITTSLFIEYGNKVYLHSISNNNILDEESKYLSYYDFIKYYKNYNIKEFIQDEDDNSIKKEFGGNKIEYIEKMEYIPNPILYFILKRILKII